MTVDGVNKPKPEQNQIGNCPCCSGEQLETVYSVNNIPVHSSILLDTQEQALKYPRRDLRLVLCYDCGFIFNALFDESILEYSSTFEESQHFSDTFDSFANNLMQDLIQTCELEGKQVIEIGCGRGEFLQRLCEKGNCCGTGIDPGFREERITNGKNDNVDFIKNYFGPAYTNLTADLILCRHTLEHISSTAEFVRNVRMLAEGNEGAVVFFETPDVERILKEGAFWDVYYEHCSYFSAGSHARLFRQERFNVTELELVYDGQYIIQYAYSSPDRALPSFELENDIDRMRSLAAEFSRLAQKKLDYWQQKIEGNKQQGKKIALWGGGSKAVAFLTTSGMGELVDFIVDINPHKQKKYLPGGGHKIEAPESLSTLQPDYVIMMNPVYLEEIRNHLTSLGIQPEIEAVA